VLADQRARLEGAMVELVAERGYSGVTVRSLARAAGVSTRTFYKHFANVDECFASTYGSLMECALRRASGSPETDDDRWRSMREGLRSVMRGAAEHPKAAHLALVDFFEADPAMGKQMRLAIREFEQLLADRLGGDADRVEVPPSIVQGMAAGVARVARTRVLDGRAGELPELAEELGDWMLSLRAAHVVEGGDKGAIATEGSGADETRRSLGAALLGGVGDERGRILSAVANLGAADGYQGLTDRRIRAEAGVSRRGFEVHFADLDDCLLEAIEALVVAAVGRAERRTAGAGSWERGIYRATVALCEELAREPALVRLGFVDILAPGRAGLRRRERLIALGADRLRTTAPAEHRPSELAAEASMAAAWKIVQAEVASGRQRHLAQIAPMVAFVLVAPAVGAGKAAAAIEPKH
jgi:AcrR family transcriptional regulator